MTRSFVGSTPWPRKDTVVSPLLRRPVKYSRGAITLTMDNFSRVAKWTDWPGNRYSNGSACPSLKYPGRTIWTWPNCASIADSRIAHNTHSMNPPAKITAITPNPIAENANRERRRLRNRLRNASPSTPVKNPPIDLTKRLSGYPNSGVSTSASSASRGGRG